MTTTFTARDVRVSFGDTEVVHGATVVARPGRVTALLGPNGAGKSTTLRAALGLVRCRGDIAIDGRVGLMLDEGGLIGSLTGRQHLESMALLKGAKRNSVEEVLQAVDMASRCEKKIGTYSLGMKRRIALAGTLLDDPDILILDEPSSGLDPDGIRWFGELIKHEAQRGKAVLMATHHLEEAAEVADDVFIIAGGETVFAGPVAEIPDLKATYFNQSRPGHRS